MGYQIEDAKIIAATESAVLVEADCFDEPAWIPQSQVSEESEIWRNGEEGTITISHWIATKKGLID